MGQGLHLFIHTAFWGKVAVFGPSLQFFSHMIVYNSSEGHPTGRIVVNLLFDFSKTID
jgi:hypothetical protein